MSMESSYYIPKTPMSVPLYDPNKKCFSVFYSDGMMADIPADLFYKMFYLKGEETDFEANYGVSQKEPEPTPERKSNENISDFINRNFSHEEIEKEVSKAHEKLSIAIRAAKMIGMSYEEFIKTSLDGSKISDFGREQLLINIKHIWDKA